MMSDRCITEAWENRLIKISPFNMSRLQPASLDLTLDREFRLPNTLISRIDLANVPIDHTETHRIDNNGLVLDPGDFVLGSTRELIGLDPRVSARVEGKSSLGRLGLAVHITAGFIDPGFEGHITLEIVNLSPWEIVLYPGMAVAQIAFYRMDRAPDTAYGQLGRNHYLHQRGPTESRYEHSLDPQYAE